MKNSEKMLLKSIAHKCSNDEKDFLHEKFRKAKNMSNSLEKAKQYQEMMSIFE